MTFEDLEPSGPQLRFFVCDTETTGLDPATDRVIEVAYALVTEDEILCAGESLVDPEGVKISSEARAVHHIGPNELEGQPVLLDVLKTFAKQIMASTGSNAVDAYVAHNTDHDAAFLPQLQKAPWLCTYKLAKKLFPELPKHGNQYLRYELGLNVPEAAGKPAHRAMADVYVTAHLLQHLLRKAKFDSRCPKTLPEILAYLDEPNLIEICRFKKHAGKTWEEVARTDPDYIAWLLKPKPDSKPLDGDIRHTLEHWQKTATPAPAPGLESGWTPETHGF